jgi:hypothetical protein
MIESSGNFVIAVNNRTINHPINQPTNPAITHEIAKSLSHQISAREARQ